jgi:hypothetical protein
MEQFPDRITRVPTIEVWDAVEDVEFWTTLLVGREAFEYIWSYIHQPQVLLDGDHSYDLGKG